VIELSFKLVKSSLRLRLFRRRTILSPTWAGCSCILAIFFLGVFACVFYGESFLAETNRVPADTLVVEGWIGRNGLRAAVDEFRRGGYLYIVATGGLSSDRWDEQPQNYAEMAADYLIRLGIPRERLTVATSDNTERFRTFESAVAVSRMLHAADIKPKGINIFTLGPHARRSAIVFAKVNSDIEKIGVIGWCPPEFQRERWWQSSERSREFLDEAVGYLYEILLNSGRRSNSPEQAAQ
jgi:uncharacterized SAM-binding protein YcdF (DUF218 family)